jgi:tetratricopeptide (TPR) repeat protein/capsular polysaccharide biosynthesis protein
VSTDSSLSLRLHGLYYNLGCILHQQGKLEAAADSYCKALTYPRPDDLKPTETSSVQRHLKIGLQQHQPTKQPDHPSVDIAEDVKVYNNLGCLLAQQERWEEAVQSYQQAIALQPDQAALYNNLGRALFRQDPVQAVAAYRRAIDLQPDFALAHHNLGLALQHQGQHQAAIDCFQHTLQLDPKHLSAHGDCAVSWMALGDIERMLISLRQAILANGVMIQAYCDWVERLPNQDELTLAKKSCGRFLQSLLESSDQSNQIQQKNKAHDYLAQTYFHWANVLTAYGGSEQLQRAETYYQQALHLQPKNLIILLQLMDCLVKQGRLNAAILIGHTTLAICPDSASIYLKLGYVLEQQQQFQLAIEYYQKALDLQSQTKPKLESSNSAEKVCSEYATVSEIEFLQFHRYPSHSPCLPSSFTQVKSNLDPAEVFAPQGYYGSTWQWMIANNLTANYVALSLNAFGNTSFNQFEQSETGTSCSKVSTPEVNADKCAGLNCIRCLKQIWNQFDPTYLGDGLHFCSGNSVSVDRFPLFVAKIPQGRAWIVPQKNAWMVCNAVAVLSPDQYVLADLSRAYPGQLPGCEHSDLNLERIYEQSSLPTLKSIEGSVAVLSSLSGNTYFHWMIDVLPRIELLRISGIDLADIDWFLINGGHHSFQRETLAQLGIPAEKILSSDYHPHIQATELIAPSFPGYFGWLDEWALSFLRRSFLFPVLNAVSPKSKLFNLQSDEVANHSVEFPERIYISRSDANHRQLLNQAEVLKQLRSLGFVSVDLESLTFRDQVNLFAHAKVIIAPHGSGLTNIIFCRPETIVVELVSPHYIRHYYWVISRLLGLHHYFLVAEEVACAPVRELMYQNPLTEDIWVSLDSLKTMLQRLNLDHSTLTS